MRGRDIRLMALLALASFMIISVTSASAWAGPDLEDLVIINNETCIDSTTLNLTTSYSTYSSCCSDGLKCNTTVCDYSISQLVVCDYGCDNGACFPGSFLNEYTFALLMAISLLFMFVGYIWKYPALVILGSVFMLLVALMLLSQGLIVGRVLYTVSNNVMLTYFGIILILTSIFTIGTSLFG